MLSIGVSLINSKQNYLYYLNTRTYLQDMRFPAIDLTTAGNNDPTKITYKNFIAWAFSPTSYNELESAFQYPHIEDGIMTYDVTPHFHWTLSANTTSNQCIVWGVEYNCANINDYFFSNNRIVKKQFCINGNTANKHIYSVLNNITLPFYSNSRQCFMKLFRDATNTSDNLTQSAILLEFDIHYHYKKYGEQID